MFSLVYQVALYSAPFRLVTLVCFEKKEVRVPLLQFFFSYFMETVRCHLFRFLFLWNIFIHTVFCTRLLFNSGNITTEEKISFLLLPHFPPLTYVYLYNLLFMYLFFFARSSSLAFCHCLQTQKLSSAPFVSVPPLCPSNIKKSCFIVFSFLLSSFLSRRRLAIPSRNYVLNKEKRENLCTILFHPDKKEKQETSSFLLSCIIIIMKRMFSRFFVPVAKQSRKENGTKCQKKEVAFAVYFLEGISKYVHKLVSAHNHYRVCPWTGVSFLLFFLSFSPISHFTALTLLQSRKLRNKIDTHTI